MKHNVRTLAVCLVASLATSAFAATPWTTPAGTLSTATYSAGQTQNGLFTVGNPDITNDTFQFVPANFYAVSGSPAVTDTASVRVTAKPGRTITNISASLVGDWSTLTLGDPSTVGTGVFAWGMLTATNPLTNETVTTSFPFNNQFGGEDGTFSDTVNLPIGWKTADISLKAQLGATAAAGETSFIQLKGGTIGVETTAAAVPLPGAVLAAIPTVLVAYAARRRLKA